jgi:hypothetical protein
MRQHLDDFRCGRATAANAAEGQEDMDDAHATPYWRRAAEFKPSRRFARYPCLR